MKNTIEINGVMLSKRFLHFVDGEWVRRCRLCNKDFPPTIEHFHLKGITTKRVLDRTCKNCRNTQNNTGFEKQCSRCGIVTSATTQNFLVNRGVLMNICRECGNKTFTKATKRWQLNHPKQAWISKVMCDAKSRASKKGIAYDKDAVLELATSYIDGSLCPCCGKPMIGNKLWPSLDRLDSTKGYEKNNIEFLCYRCNRLKSDSTLSDLQMILAFVVKRSQTSC